MCKCYGLYDENSIIGFIGVLHQPHPRNTKIKRVSRLVILPDYQGIGLGYKFLTAIAKMYVEQGFDFEIITSAKNLIMKLYQSSDWICSRYDVKRTVTSKTSKIDRFRELRKCKTASFFYVNNSAKA